MKRSILAVVATTAAVVSFSCKQEKQPEPVLVSSAVEVMLSSPSTKAFGDGSTEKWEQEVKTISLFVYKKGDDACAYQREFTKYEIEKARAVFAIKDVIAEQEYDFYALANCDFSAEMEDYNEKDPAGTGVKRSVLLAQIEGIRTDDGQNSSFGNLAMYNGDFEVVSQRANRGFGASKNSGFAMSGMETQKTPKAGANEPTKVTIPLRRTVAKIAVKAGITQAFKDKYPESTLVIKEAKLTQLLNRSRLIKPDALADIEVRTAPFTQTPNVWASTEAGNTTGYDQYQNLFYIFENAVKKDDGSIEGVSDAAQKPVLVLTAEFDHDGKPGTVPTDISTITYTIKLAGEAANGGADDPKFGYFIRNGNYLVDIAVNGLSENEVVANIEVLPWETLKRQDVSIGDKD